MARICEFVVGLLFGIGLIVSGMTDPGKVIGFLDLVGPWDPSLAMVMAGAIGVGVFGFASAKRLRRTFLGEPLSLPSTTAIDKTLICGATLFGVGWGLAGFCPGPAWVSMASGQPKAVLFVASMLLGMLIWNQWKVLSN